MIYILEFENSFNNLPEMIQNDLVEITIVTTIQLFCCIDLYKQGFNYLKKQIFSFNLLSLTLVFSLYVYSLSEMIFPTATVSVKTYFAEFSVLTTILLLERYTFFLLKKDFIEKYKFINRHLGIKKYILNNNISIITNSFIKNRRILRSYPLFILFTCIGSFLFWLIYDRTSGIGDTLLLSISPVMINIPFMISLSLSSQFINFFSLKKDFSSKNSKAIEMVDKVNTLIFDKTVVINDKIPMITDIFTFNDFDGNTVLKIAASIENQANNSIAQAIVKEAKSRKFNLWVPSDFHQILGVGIEASVNGYAVYIGSKELMKMKNINTLTMERIANKLSSEFKTPIFIAVDGKPAGIIAMLNTVKSEAVNMADEFKKININLVMITGDSLKSGISYGESLGLTSRNIYTDCTPVKKLKVIEDLKTKGHKLAILRNDSESEYHKIKDDLVISIDKNHKDIYLDDIIIHDSYINTIKDVFSYSLKVMKRIRQNLFWSYIYSITGLIFSYGLLIKFTAIKPSPVILGVFTLISIIFIYINSLKK